MAAIKNPGGTVILDCAARKLLCSRLPLITVLHSYQKLHDLK